jgi:hypothetical protein
LLLHFALELGPVSLNPIPIHWFSPFLFVLRPDAFF